MSNVTSVSTLSQNTALIQQIENLADTTNKVLALSTRAANPENGGALSLKVMDDKKLSLIQDRMVEIDRATRAFGKSNSQTTSRFMSLTMLNEGPYHQLSQCLAQIERKRGALKENTFKIQKDTIELKRKEAERNYLVQKLSGLESHIADLQTQEQDTTVYDGKTLSELEYEVTTLRFDIETLNIEIAEKVANLSDTTEYYEAAVKEIAIFQESYEEIRTNNNIPEHWDEVDYENGEVAAHVKTAFRLVLRDLEMTGRLNCATMEYLEQFGINPMTAKELAVNYYDEQKFIMNGCPDPQTGEPTQERRMPTIHALNNFMNQMVDVFKDSYKDAMAIRGLNTHISDWAAYTDEDRAETRLLAQPAVTTEQ